MNVEITDSCDFLPLETPEPQLLRFHSFCRGMAVRDPSSRHGVRLVVEDYPYAADGLELWTAIKEWNTEYVDIYYKNDKAIRTDTELQSWWGEIRNQAHADKRDAPAGWPVPSSKRSLVDILTTLQWIASCQHAAVNFGQYDYAGFMPHHPTLTRRLLPDDEGNSKGCSLTDFVSSITALVSHNVSSNSTWRTR